MCDPATTNSSPSLCKLDCSTINLREMLRPECTKSGIGEKSGACEVNELTLKDARGVFSGTALAASSLRRSTSYSANAEVSSSSRRTAASREHFQVG